MERTRCEGYSSTSKTKFLYIICHDQNILIILFNVQQVIYQGWSEIFGMFGALGCFGRSVSFLFVFSLHLGLLCLEQSARNMWRFVLRLAAESTGCCMCSGVDVLRDFKALKIFSVKCATSLIWKIRQEQKTSKETKLELKNQNNFLELENTFFFFNETFTNPFLLKRKSEKLRITINASNKCKQNPPHLNIRMQMKVS